MGCNSHRHHAYTSNTLGDLDILAIWSEENYHGYIGFWSAALTGVGINSMIQMQSDGLPERFSIRSCVDLYRFLHCSNLDTGLTTIYLVPGLFGFGFGITFFIGVLIYWFATHEDYGGWMNRELHEPSQARVFWSNHWAGIMTFMAFLVALAIRSPMVLCPVNEFLRSGIAGSYWRV